MSETEYPVPEDLQSDYRDAKGSRVGWYPIAPETAIKWIERIAELERIIASMKLADDEKADSLNSYRVALETAIGQRDEARRAVVKLALASRAPQTVTDEQIGNAMREAGYDTAGTKAEIFWEAVKASRARKGSPK